MMRKLILFTENDFISQLEKAGKSMNDFSQDQLKELHEGAKNGVDISVYANEDLTNIQMRMIRWGLEEGLDAAKYADPSINLFQMQKMYIELERSQNSLWQFDELLMNVV